MFNKEIKILIYAVLLLCLCNQSQSASDTGDIKGQAKGYMKDIVTSFQTLLLSSDVLDKLTQQHEILVEVLRSSDNDLRKKGLSEYDKFIKKEFEPVIAKQAKLQEEYNNTYASIEQLISDILLLYTPKDLKDKFEAVLKMLKAKPNLTDLNGAKRLLDGHRKQLKSIQSWANSKLVQDTKIDIDHSQILLAAEALKPEMQQQLQKSTDVLKHALKSSDYQNKHYAYYDFAKVYKTILDSLVLQGINTTVSGESLVDNISEADVKLQLEVERITALVKEDVAPKMKKRLQLLQDGLLYVMDHYNPEEQLEKLEEYKKYYRSAVVPHLKKKAKRKG